MTIKEKFFLVLFNCCVPLVLFNCCAPQNNQTQVQEGVIFELPYILSFEKEIDDVQLTDLNEIGSSIIYIPLQTNDLSLLSELRKILFTDKHIAVLDRGYRLLLFDTSGNFIRQISRRGQGPGEISNNFFDYCFSFDGQRMYLLVDDYKCFEYDLENHFLNAYKLDSMPEMMLSINNNVFVFKCCSNVNLPNRPSRVKQSLFISDLHNNIQKSFPNYFQQNNEQMLAVKNTPFYTYQGNIRFKEFGVDTLYSVTEEELMPYAIITLGAKEIPPNLVVAYENFMTTLTNRYARHYYVSRILECTDNLYIQFSHYLNDGVYGYFNKNNNAIKVIGEKGFLNNIDGGLPFFPKYVYNDNILVDYVNAFTLREHVLNGNASEMRRLYGQKYDDLVKLANSLDDESNPVLIIVKK